MPPTRQPWRVVFVWHCRCWCSFWQVNPGCYFAIAVLFAPRNFWPTQGRRHGNSQSHLPFAVTDHAITSVYEGNVSVHLQGFVKTPLSSSLNLVVLSRIRQNRLMPRLVNDSRKKFRCIPTRASHWIICGYLTDWEQSLRLCRFFMQFEGSNPWV